MPLVTLSCAITSLAMVDGETKVTGPHPRPGGPPRQGPDCSAALEKRPAAAGATQSVQIAYEPDDWPKSITLPGSPPKAATFALSQRNATMMS